MLFCYYSLFILYRFIPLRKVRLDVINILGMVRPLLFVVDYYSYLIFSIFIHFYIYLFYKRCGWT